jgi:hypothetical protein
VTRAETRYETADGDIKGGQIVKDVVKVVLGITGFFLVLWVVLSLAAPQLRLYKANTEKKAAIAEARAQSDAAEYTAERKVKIATSEAEADRIRAVGIADANETIASSLTDEYNQWYFIDRLDDVNGQIIYVPTEAGVPITEGGRARDVTPESQE